MNREAAPDNSARQAAENYQAAAREAWRMAGANGSLRLTVISDSMRPLLQTGDVAVVHSVDPGVLQPGDVVVIQRDGEWITHRLVAVDGHGWHTHGDNTRYLDETASADQVVGRVIAIEDLLARVWGAEFVGQPQVLYVHIRWLREKLEEDPQKPRRILTVRGVGYKLASRIEA